MQSIFERNVSELQSFFEGGVGRDVFGIFGEFLSARSIALFASGCRNFQLLVKSKEWDHVWIDVSQRSKEISFVRVRIEPVKWWCREVIDYIHDISDIKCFCVMKWHKSYSNILARMTQLEHLQLGTSHNGRTFDGTMFSGITSLTSIKSNMPIYNLKALTNLKRLHLPGIPKDDELNIVELRDDVPYFYRSGIRLKLPKLKILSCYPEALENYEGVTSLETLRLKTCGEEVNKDEIWLKYTSLKNLDVKDTGFRPHNYPYIHRENGPAVVLTNHGQWYRHGRTHREDGPAV